MINPLPWKLDEGDPSIIYDANGDVIAKDYTFINMDDFEAICKLVNSSTKFKEYNHDEAIPGIVIKNSLGVK